MKTAIPSYAIMLGHHTASGTAGRRNLRPSSLQEIILAFQ